MAIINRENTEELIASLMKGESTLEQIARRLEDEAERRFCKEGEVNPVQLVKRIRNLASELPKLRACCQALLSAKQGLLDAAKTQLVANYNLLKQICDAAGAERLNDAEFYSFNESVGEWTRKLNERVPIEDRLQWRREINEALVRNAMETHS